MKIWIFLIICFFLSNSIFASEITIIELHNQSIDQAILNTLQESQEDSELSEVNVLDDHDNQESNGNIKEKDNEHETILKELDQLIDCEVE